MKKKENTPIKKPQETVMEYQQRLNQYCAGIIGLIESYEKAANLERFRNLLPLTKKLLEDENPKARKEVTELIIKLDKEINWYEIHYSQLSKEKEIHRKKKALDSLVS